MNSVVRRVERPTEIVNTNDGAIQLDDQFQPEIVRHSGAFTLITQKSQGIQPRILISWGVASTYWRRGCTLMGFRSIREFADSKYPEKLREHGQMILEETANGSIEDWLPEGTYFYAFVLHRKKCFGLMEEMSVVRFSETIPSLKIAIGRIEDEVRLRELREIYELRNIESQVAMNEAMVALHRSNKKLLEVTAPKPDDSLEAQVRREVEAEVRRKLKKAMTRVELVSALHDVRKQLKRNPGWKRVSRAQQEKLLNETVADLDDEEDSFQP